VRHDTTENGSSETGSRGVPEIEAMLADAYFAWCGDGDRDDLVRRLVAILAQLGADG